MKKLLLVLFLMLVTSSSAFALSYPRWANFPLTVYIESESENSIRTQTVKQAFEAWKTIAESQMRFIYKTDAKFQNISQIRVTFVDKFPQKVYFEIIPTLSHLIASDREGFGFCYYLVDVKIRKTDFSGRPFTKEKLYSIALQAVGKSLGVECFNQSGSVMSCDGNFTATELTKSDKAALDYVYKTRWIRGRRLFY